MGGACEHGPYGSLTDLGQSLCGPVKVMAEWALTHHEAIDTARATFDAQSGEVAAGGGVSVGSG